MLKKYIYDIVFLIKCIITGDDFMLKILNILGYISLLSIPYLIALFILSFDLFLKIINIIFIVILAIINFKFFRKKKYLGIKFLVVIIILFTFSFMSYNIYKIIRGNTFKTKIYRIYNNNKNVILTTEDISDYNVKFVPDKLIIDSISKGGASKGYIKFFNSNEYEEILYENFLNYYKIIYNSNRYYFNKKQ